MLTIRLAIEDDAAALPDIERSSGQAFRHLPGLEWIADDSVTSSERHLELIRQGTAWVSQDDNLVVTGFLIAEVHHDALHIWQMSVQADQQKRGIGRELIRVANRWAKENRLSALTLTTFRDVPWNAHFYETCGFALIDPTNHPMLLATIQAEREAGLPEERRCAMLRSL